jgi:hypothetical protein
MRRDARMPHFNETSRPLIEITISRTVLRRCLVVVPLGLLPLLGVIGAVISPLVNGHPMILTRERLALKHYLEAAQDWISRLNKIGGRLGALSSALVPAAGNVLANTSAISLTQIPTGSLSSQMSLPAQAPLATFHTPVSQPITRCSRCFCGCWCPCSGAST